MRDAFGGSFMLAIMITFFVIFITLIGLVVRITNTFKVKSDVLTYLQLYDISPNQLDEEAFKPKISEFLKSSSYFYSSEEYSSLWNDCNHHDGRYFDGICIVPVVDSDDDALKKYYYVVYSYIPIIDHLFNFGDGYHLTFKSEGKSTLCNGGC